MGVAVRFIYARKNRLLQFTELVQSFADEEIEYSPVLCEGDMGSGSIDMDACTFVEGSVLEKKSVCSNLQKLLDSSFRRIILLIDREQEQKALDFIGLGAETYFFWDGFGKKDLERIIRIRKVKSARIEKGNDNLLDTFYLKTIFEEAKEPIAVIDTEGRYLKINPAYQKLFGYSEEYLLNKTPAVLIGEDQLQKNMKILREGDGHLNKETEIISKAGKKLIIELSLYPIKNWQNETIAYIGINKDRTGEREVLSRLHQSEDKFEKAFKASPDAISISRLSDGLYADINEGFTRLTGYTRKELMGKTTFDISLWYDKEDRQTLIRKLREYGFVKDVGVKFRRKDGTIRSGTMSANILEFNNEEYLLAVTRDVTEWLDVQDALLKSETNLKQAQRIAHLGSWEFNSKTGVVSFSEEAGRILGIPLTLLTVRLSKLQELVHKDTAKVFSYLIHDNLNKGVSAFESSLEINRLDGQIRHGYIIGEVQLDNEKKVVSVNGSIQDITETVKAREQIEESENALRQFAETTNDKILRTDLEGRITYLIGPIEQLFGYKHEDLLNTLIFEYIHPDDLDYVVKTFAQAMKEKVSDVEYRFRNKKGEYIWVESKGNAIYDKNGQVVGMIAGTTVIQERKLAEQRLKESEEKHRLLIENNFDLIAEIDRKGQIIYISQNVEKLLGYSQSELIGYNFRELIHPSERRHIKTILNEEFGNFDLRYRHKNGDWRWFESAVKNYKNLAGGIITLIISKDVTERMVYEQALVESELKFRSLTENARDIIMRFNRNHQLLYSNSAGKSWFGEGNAGESIHINESLLKNEILRDIKLCIELVFNTGEEQRLQFTLELNGARKTYDWQAVPEFTAKKKVESVLGVARDITSLTETQDELNRLHQVLQHSTNSIILTDKHGKIEYVNPKTLEITGYDYDELIGRNPRILKSGHTSREVYKQLWEMITSGKTWKGELYNRKKNGDFYWEFAVISPIKSNEGEIVNYLAIKEDITNKKATEEQIRQSKETLAMTLEANHIGTWSWDLTRKEYVLDQQSLNIYGWDEDIHERAFHADEIGSIIHPEDTEMVKKSIYKALKKGDIMDLDFRIIDRKKNIKYLITKSRITRNKEGWVTRIDGICMDVSDIKKTEETLKIRNEELNQFVYKVSHDLRAPLASIRGIVELEKIQNRGKPTIVHLDLIEERVMKLDEFIRNILSHSRNLNTMVTYTLIDFEKIIEGCYKELEFLKNALNIKRYTKITGPGFYSDETRLYEIFRNLLSNCIKYVDYDKSEPIIKLNIRSTGKECLIEIEDNGIGIQKQFHDKIYNMFFRANEKSEGSGIGLYIVKLAVEKLGGTIAMESKHMEGTKFSIRLPNQVSQVVDQ